VSDNGDKPNKSDDSSLAIPVIWGVGAGLFAAVLTRGVLAGGIVVVLALVVFGAVVLSARPQRIPRRRRKRGRTAAPMMRTGPPKPPSKMTQAAMERPDPLPPAVPGQPGDWLRRVQTMALGRDGDDDDTPSGKE
jgi:hypothetical protein